MSLLFAMPSGRSLMSNATLLAMENVRVSALTSPARACGSLSACLGQVCRISKHMRFEFMSVSHGDVLLVGDSAACRVEACVEYGTRYGLLFVPLELLDRPSRTTSQWRQREELQFAELSKGLVRHPSAWFPRHEDNTLIVLAPLR